jgi:MFS family permease
MVGVGFLDGGLWGLAALLVTDVAGVEDLNFAWGFFNSAASFASVSGPPLAGRDLNPRSFVVIVVG